MILDIKTEIDPTEKQKQTKLVYKKVIIHMIDIKTGEEFQSTGYPFNKNTSAINMYLCGKIYSDKKEAALFTEHKKLEREYGLKLRYKRSNRKLAEPWNEVPSSFQSKKKCWKDNSKRRKQYYKDS